MHRYWLFGGDHYYPQGGMVDYKGSFPLLDTAIEAANQMKPPAILKRSPMRFGSYDWWHIIDTQKATIVAQSEGGWPAGEWWKP